MGMASYNPDADDADSPYSSQPTTPTSISRMRPRPRALHADVDALLDAEEAAEARTGASSTSSSPPVRPRLSASQSAAAAAGISSPSDDGEPLSPAATGAGFDDVRFDSDEQVDVESLASSVPDDIPSAPTSPTELPPRPTSPTSIPSPTSGTAVAPRPPTTKTTPSLSLLSRASHTFYKAFRKKKSSVPPSTAPASPPMGTAAATSSCSSSSTASSPPNAGTDQHERLSRLIDAQLAALAGARTGFVDLQLLRPLAEQTATALSRDARPLLADAGELEVRVTALRRQMSARRADAEEETMRKERVLIDAKVALAEAMGDVERLRGELAAVKRELSAPDRRMRGMRRRAEEMRGEVVSRREARLTVETKVSEKRTTLAKEKADLDRLAEGVRDLEGDWA